MTPGNIGGTVDVDVMTRNETITLLTRRVPAITPETADAIADVLSDLGGD